ncbi:DNA-binding transcriptional regulator, AcrR family [Thermomonospora echinospora]|uniref:DNA-binding transcriptional regulator, AcrR family n=1 Tax=Thermomonospora echinospora TaxID=1992 RepID=A0A1H6E505_9ACTN|nr:DNA-binding transcriptional regulator, AcrR family [Thermomonospora echinospora]
MQVTSQRKPRGPYRKGIERREQILKTALDVFAQHGDRGSSLQEIADRVGLSQAGVLHYFGSREELLLAVLERRDRLDSEVANEVQNPGDAVAQTVRHNTEQPGLVKLFVALSAAATDPAHHAHGFFADRYRNLADVIARGLEEGQWDGRVRADEQAEHMARLLLAVSDGLQIQWLLDPSLDMAAMVETFNRMCLAWAGPEEQEPEPTR